jgi:uncharacterized membrane protein
LIFLDPSDAPRPTRLQWLWFASAFLVGLSILALIPPFQTNDETLHWVKTYSVSQGDTACVSIPSRAADLIASLHYQQVRDGGKFYFAFYDEGFATVNRTRVRVSQANLGACSYPSFAYAIAATFVRVTQALWPQDRGAMVVAFFAARMANWLTLSIAVLLLMLAVPRVCTWTLFVYSIPMMIHQCVSVNQDAMIMALHMLLVIAFFRLSHWRQLVAIALIVSLLTLIKPVSAPLSLWMAPAVWQVARASGVFTGRRRLIVFGGGAVAIATIALWRLLPFIMLRRDAHLGSPSWTNPGEQVYTLFHHPTVLLQALIHQLHDNLGHGHLTGGFTSVLGVFGWCQYELQQKSYFIILGALVLALAADGLRPGMPGLRAVQGWQDRVLYRVLPALAPVFVILLIDVAFWVIFTPPKAKYIIGVQGRYYHGALFLLGVLVSTSLSAARVLTRLRHMLLHHGLVLGSWLCMMVVWRDVFSLVERTYYVNVSW